MSFTIFDRFWYPLVSCPVSVSSAVPGIQYLHSDCFCVPVLSLVSSILTLTLIACDRFFGIVFAMKAHTTEQRSAVFLVLVWVTAVAISSPLLIYRQQFSRVWLDHVEIWCDDTWPPHVTSDPVTGQQTITYPARRIYYTCISVVLYFLPISVMSLAYSFIIWRLWSKAPPGERIGREVKSQERIKKKVGIRKLISTIRVLHNVQNVSVVQLGESLTLRVS